MDILGDGHLFYGGWNSNLDIFFSKFLLIIQRSILKMNAVGPYLARAPYKKDPITYNTRWILGGRNQTIFILLITMCIRRRRRFRLVFFNGEIK